MILLFIALREISQEAAAFKQAVNNLIFNIFFILSDKKSL